MKICVEMLFLNNLLHLNMCLIAIRLKICVKMLLMRVCLFMLKYCHDRYKTQEICEKSILWVLKSVHDWIVMPKMFKNYDNGVFFNVDIDLDDVDFDNVNFDNDEIDNIDLDNDALLRLIASCSKYKQCKVYKKR